MINDFFLLNKKRTLNSKKGRARNSTFQRQCLRKFFWDFLSNECQSNFWKVWVAENCWKLKSYIFVSYFSILMYASFYIDQMSKKIVDILCCCSCCCRDMLLPDVLHSITLFAFHSNEIHISRNKNNGTK